MKRLRPTSLLGRLVRALSYVATALAALCAIAFCAAWLGLMRADLHDLYWLGGIALGASVVAMLLNRCVQDPSSTELDPPADPR